MNDKIHALANWVDHNRNTVAAILVAVVLLVGMSVWQGCKSTTVGFRGEKVPRAVFTIEALQEQATLAGEQAQIDAAIAKNAAAVTAYNARVEAGIEDLDAQDAYKAEALETIGAIATQVATGGLNPVSLIPIAIGLLGGAYGVGKKADNVRKDTVIAALKAPTVA